eukprot:Em0017g559a
MEASPDGMLFVPNPKDGSMYALTKQGGKLERLPMTIPQLVHLSPTQSSDGLLYTARKQDTWMVVNADTGTKLHMFSTDGWSCYLASDRDENPLYIGRTAYTVTVYDGATKQQRWNATYFQYSPHSSTDQSSQDTLYLCSNSDGSVVSLDALTGQYIWKHSYSSPVVSIFNLESGILRKLLISSFATEDLPHIGNKPAIGRSIDAKLQQSLFIGTRCGQLYAMDSFADESAVKQESVAVPLLEGPGAGHTKPTTALSETDDQSSLGHFCLPHDASAYFTPFTDHDWYMWKHYSKPPSVLGHEASSADKNTNLAEITNIRQNVDEIDPLVKTGPATLHSVVITVVGSALIAAAVSFVITKLYIPGGQKDQKISPALSEATTTDNSSDKSSGGAAIIELKSDCFSLSANAALTTEIIVGKISFSLQDVIGHGSHGTVVYSGVFDQRPVAIKRILPECFELAEKEVALLRESDYHPNVVRYFCKEQDMVFTYIALELCQATLYEYISSSRHKHWMLDPLNLLYQATTGLSHLHSLGIVHRDLKPQNILLSMTVNGARVLISDFGLCRKLPQGKASFTAKSGVMGTEGWIAPECLRNESRVTCAVDIFSLGCIFYYVLSNGEHPFGPPLRRQANIDADNSALSALTGDDRYVAQDLVACMISHNFCFRPTSQEVLSHCLFWTKEKQLAFLQDVSDRIEKETVTSSVVQSLEQGATHVVGRDWKAVIGEELRDDLRRFRTYHGGSLRDLLRAMRNKKHHYQELPEDVKKSLGNIPEGFLQYFTSRFPLLLIHTYKRMECCKKERVFQTYYIHVSVFIDKT